MNKKQKKPKIGNNDDYGDYGDYGNEQDEDSELQSDKPSKASGTTNITFHNTANYGKTNGPSADSEDPVTIKYTKGNGSVKGLHYMRYIALELISEYTFTLSFHKFYSQEVKNLIKNIEKSRFDPELRKWTLSVQAYDEIMAELKKICTAN